MISHWRGVQALYVTDLMEAWFKHVGKAVLLVARCMSGGGISVVEFSSVNCTIKCSNSLVVPSERKVDEGGGILTSSIGPCVWSLKRHHPGIVKLV